MKYRVSFELPGEPSVQGGRGARVARAVDVEAAIAADLEDLWASTARLRSRRSLSDRTAVNYCCQRLAHSSEKAVIIGSEGVSEWSIEAVLKSIVAIALGCTERHSFRKVGTQMHAVELSGTGVGIKVGIKR
jgi:hypothetical protein